MTDPSIIQLWQRYFSEGLTTEEKQILAQWIEEQPDNEELKQLLENSWNTFTTTEVIPASKAELMLSQILSRAKTLEVGKTNVIPISRRWTKWIAAASIILIIGISTYVILSGVEGRHKEQTTARTQDVPAPTNTRAVITLANGTKVYLDSAGNGILAQENNVNIVRNSNGEIQYMSPAGGGGLNDSSNNKRPGVDINTIYNPRGSKVISLTLSDGTKVWLNSESSLRYPASFAANAVTREVEITGEAYFEVAHFERGIAKNAKGTQRTQGQLIPFIVKKGDVSVTVLGTHFNVNAYDDEDALRVTLLEGSVRVTAANAANAAVKLKPGEQAVATRNSLLTTRSVDLEEVMSWKNGRFYYDGVNIKTIMKEISRWYNVEVEYKDDINYSFVAKISRDVPVSQLLKIIELTDLVHFKIEGNKIIVSK